MAAATAILAGAGIASQIAGPIIGRIASADDREKAQKALNEAYETIQNIGAPPDLSKEIILEKLKQVGVYKPEMEKDIELGVSKVSQIKEDPRLRDAQTKALELIQQRGQTGIGPEERAAYNKLRNEVERDAQSKRASILQNLAERGLAGGGAEIAAQLSASQAADQRLAEEGDRLAADAARKSLEALTQSAQIGTQVRGQDFDINRAKSQAEDEFQRFNVQNQIDRERRNVASKNEAQQKNLSEQQRISDYNTAMGNQEKYRQAEAQRQYYQDRLKQAGEIAAAKIGQAKNYQDLAGQTQSMYGGIGAGIGQGLLSGANTINTNEQKALDRQANILTSIFSKK